MAFITRDKIGSNKQTIPDEDDVVLLNPTTKYKPLEEVNSSMQLMEYDSVLVLLQPNLHAESRWPDEGSTTSRAEPRTSHDHFPERLHLPEILEVVSSVVSSLSKHSIVGLEYSFTLDVQFESMSLSGRDISRFLLQNQKRLLPKPTETYCCVGIYVLGSSLTVWSYLNWVKRAQPQVSCSTWLNPKSPSLISSSIGTSPRFMPPARRSRDNRAWFVSSLGGSSS